MSSKLLPNTIEHLLHLKPIWALRSSGCAQLCWSEYLCFRQNFWWHLLHSTLLLCLRVVLHLGAGHLSLVEGLHSPDSECLVQVMLGSSPGMMSTPRVQTGQVNTVFPLGAFKH